MGIYGYNLGEKHSLFISGRDGPTFVTWQFLDVQVDKQILDGLPGFVMRREFGTETGQVLYVTLGDAIFVYVDIGSAEELKVPAEPGTRLYFIMPRY